MRDMARFDPYPLTTHFAAQPTDRGQRFAVGRPLSTPLCFLFFTFAFCLFTFAFLCLPQNQIQPPGERVQPFLDGGLDLQSRIGQDLRPQRAQFVG